MNSITLSFQSLGAAGDTDHGDTDGVTVDAQQERQRLRETLLAGAASSPGSIANGDYFAALRTRVGDAR